MRLKYYLSYLLSQYKLLFVKYYLVGSVDYLFNKKFIFEKFDCKDIDLMEACLNQMDFQGEFTISEMLKRISKGHFLYVIKDKKDIVGYLWVASKLFKIPYFSATIILKNDEILTYNVYININYRGQNLFNQIKAYALQDFYKKGYKKEIGYYFSWNKASSKANLKFGSIPIGSVRFGYFLFFKYLKNSVEGSVFINHENCFVLWHKLYIYLKKCLSFQK